MPSSSSPIRPGRTTRWVTVWLKTGDYKTAVVHLEIASSRLPEFAEAHALLAEAYDHLGRAEDAKRERSKAAAPAPRKP